MNLPSETYLVLVTWPDTGNTGILNLLKGEGDLPLMDLEEAEDYFQKAVAYQTAFAKYMATHKPDVKTSGTVLRLVKAELTQTVKEFTLP